MPLESTLKRPRSAGRRLNIPCTSRARGLGCTEVYGVRTWERGRPALDANARGRPLEGKMPSLPGNPVPLYVSRAHWGVRTCADVKDAPV